MGIFIFYRRGPSLQERRDDAGQRIWIIPKNNNKKQKKNGNTRNQPIRAHNWWPCIASEAPFVFFPCPAVVSDGDGDIAATRCVLFLFTHWSHPKLPGIYSASTARCRERESQWSNRIELTPKGRKSRTALFFHFHFLSPFFFLHYSASSRLIYLQNWLGFKREMREFSRDVVCSVHYIAARRTPNAILEYKFHSWDAMPTTSGWSIRSDTISFRVCCVPWTIFQFCFPSSSSHLSP